MDLESNYEIAPTADFIYSRNFTRVALQVTLNKPPKKKEKRKKRKLPKTLEIISRFFNPLFGFRESQKQNIIFFCVNGIGNDNLPNKRRKKIITEAFREIVEIR